MILGVAAQEMLHWALVNNLLTAVGSAPYVARPHMPHQAKGYPAGVQLALVPFGERALRHFLFLERPEGLELRDADGFDPSGPALPIMAATDIVPWGQEFHTVGHLYRSIQAGIRNLADKLGEEQLFIGPREAQASRESFGWPQLVPIIDTATASPRRSTTSSSRARAPAATGARPTTAASSAYSTSSWRSSPTTRRSSPPIRSSAPACGRSTACVPDVVITDPPTAAVSDLFNVTYDLILQIVVRFLANVGEDDEQLDILADAAVTLMFAVIKPLGLLLATLPVGPEHPGVTAGANFQLFYQKSFLLPHRRATWIRFTERLDEAAEFADGIGGDGNIRLVLGEVGKTLHRLATRMASRID